MTVIARGIWYYDMTEVKKHLYMTMEAKKLEQMILAKKFNLSSVSSAPKVEFKTAHLNFFIGDYHVIAIPKRIIQLTINLENLIEIQHDPIQKTTEIEELIEKFIDELDHVSDAITPESIMENSTYVIVYSLGEDNMKQLYGVFSGIPSHFEKFFKDERIYKLDNGKDFFSEDGLPTGVYYYYDEDGVVRYTRNKKKGKQIGTE